MDHTNIIQIYRREKQNVPKSSKNSFEKKVKCILQKIQKPTTTLIRMSKKCDQSQFLFAKNDSAKTWKLIPY